MKTRKYLSADGLFELIRQEFQKTEDHRPMNVEIPLVDTLMSGIFTQPLEKCQSSGSVSEIGYCPSFLASS